MADIGLIAQAVTTAPEGYQVPGAQEIILKSVFAEYDGSGAGGNFVPTLQILAPNGSVVASCPLSTTVTAGASVDVCWFPRGGLSQATGGSGIKFDTDPQTGGYLYTTTTGPGNPDDGSAYSFNDTSGLGSLFNNQNGGGWQFNDDFGVVGQFAYHGNTGSTVQLETPTSTYEANAASGSVLSDTSGKGMTIVSATGGATGGLGVLTDPSQYLGFYGVTNVQQPATPATLGDVIAALQALGLVA